MGINRQYLMQRLVSTANALVNEARLEHEKKQREWDTAFEKWSFEKAPELEQVLRDALSLLLADKPVTRDELPGVLGTSWEYEKLVFQLSSKRPADFDPATFAFPRWYLELQEAVNAVDGDVIAQSYLEKAGVISSIKLLRS